MTQNLRIVGPKTLTQSDSQVLSSGYNLPASSEDGWCNTLASIDDGNCINTQNVFDSGSADYGAYYSWAAATAGSGTASTAPGSNAPYSICPKGWRLPVGGTSGDFQALYNIYGSTLVVSPINFVLAGAIENGTIKNRNKNGLVWASTGASVNTAYRLNATSNDSQPSYDYYKFYGYSVRCVNI